MSKVPATKPVNKIVLIADGRCCVLVAVGMALRVYITNFENTKEMQKIPDIVMNEICVV